MRSRSNPDSDTSIDGEVFYTCSSLATIYYTGSADDWAAIEGLAGALIPEDCEIIYNYVPTNE